MQQDNKERIDFYDEHKDKSFDFPILPDTIQPWDGVNVAKWFIEQMLHNNVGWLNIAVRTVNDPGYEHLPHYFAGRVECDKIKNEFKGQETNLNLANQFNPKKIDFYSLLKKNKICDLDISGFNTEEAQYTTMQRSSLVEFLKEKLPSNLIQYNKIVNKINSTSENIELTFADQSLAICDYLVVSDGIFSSTKSLILNRDIKPKYFKSIAIRGTINKEDLNSIDCSNISLFWT